MTGRRVGSGALLGRKSRMPESRRPTLRRKPEALSLPIGDEGRHGFENHTAVSDKGRSDPIFGLPRGQRATALQNQKLYRLLQRLLGSRPILALRKGADTAQRQR